MGISMAARVATTRSVRTALAVAIVLAATSVAAAPAPKQGSESTAVASAGPVRASDLFHRTLRGTVFLVADLPEKGFSAGSGWLVDAKRRLVITNDHVVERARRVRAYFPMYKDGSLVAERPTYLKEGRAIEGELIDSDPKCDLALVRLSAVPGGAAALVLAPQSPAIGETIHSIGNPGAIDALWVYTHGTVRAVHRFRERDGVFEARVVETQSPVNAGDSGGPAVNDRGELVAVVSRGRRDARLLQQFIDVTEVRAYLQTAMPLVDPKTAEQFNTRGVRRHARGRFDDAICDFTDALRLDATFREALNNRGWCFYEKGDFTTALRDFDAAIQGGYREFGAYRGRAYANQRAGKSASVVADLNEAIRRRPDDAGLYFDRGMAQALAGRSKQAIADFTASIERGPTAAALYHRACLRSRNGRDEEALRDFAAALDREGENAEILNARGACLYKLGRYDEALADHHRALRLDASNAEYYNDRGLVFYKLEQYRQALEDFCRAVALDGKNAVYWYNRGMAQKELGDLDAAQTDFEKAAELDPKKYQGRQTRFYGKHVRVTNASKERIKVYAVYRAVDDDGKRRWVPGEPGQEDPAVWTFDPGETAVLAYQGQRIVADVIRLWAKSASGAWTEWKDQDQEIAPPGGYFGEKMLVYTFTFN